MAAANGSSFYNQIHLATAGPDARVVARTNGSPEQMLTECVEALGGISSFISQGDRVAIKVNGSWNNPSANTHPEVVRQVVLLAREAKPSQITVFDHTIERAGWPALARSAEEAGATAVELRGSWSEYMLRDTPGVSLKSIGLAKILDECDALINVPKLKTHSGGHVTISLKNHMGSVLDRGAIHDGGGRGLHQGIADLNACPVIRTKQRLILCDAISPMVKGGPSAGTHAQYSGILGGTDAVALDLIGTQIIQRYNQSLPERPPHIALAADLGLGIGDPSRIRFDEADVGQPIPEASLGYALASAASLAILRRRTNAKGIRGG